MSLELQTGDNVADVTPVWSASTTSPFMAIFVKSSGQVFMTHPAYRTPDVRLDFRFNR